MFFSRAAACLVKGLEVSILCTSRSTAFQKEPISPFATASIWSRLWFVWASPFVAHVALSRQRVSLADVWELREQERAATTQASLSLAWCKEKDLAASQSRPPSLPRAMFKVIWRAMLWVFIYKMGWLLFAMISNALLLREVIAFFSDPSRPAWEGGLLVAAYFVVETLRSLCVNQHWLGAMLSGLQLRAAARNLVFDKLLRMRGAAGSIGTVVTLISNDAQRFLDACQYGEFVVSTPITLVVTLGIIWSLVGVSSLAGFVVLLLCAPLQAKLGQWVGSIRRATIKITEERSKLMAEALSAIKFVKLTGMEQAMANRVADLREREVRCLRLAAIVRVINTVVAFIAPVLVTLATFAASTMSTGQPLTPSTAFIVLALFNVARFPLNLMPQATKQISEALVGAARLQAFLMEPDVEDADQPIHEGAFVALATSPTHLIEGPSVNSVASARANDTNKGSLLSEPLSSAPAEWNSDNLLPSVALDATSAMGSVAVRAVHATYIWEDDSTPSAVQGVHKSSSKLCNLLRAKTLTSGSSTASAAVEAERAREPAGVRDICFEVQRGQCIGIVGAVGAGKSSLFSALLGQMRRVDGSFSVSGTLSFAPQAAWVFSGSLRDNVLFGLPFDASRYEEALHMCALDDDVAALPAGDATEIGERGLNLSGGQKARVGLARAVYADRDVYCLDDPLSAVDVHVGRHLWQRCVTALAQKGKTVLIATHQLQYLSSCDSILVMNKGGVIDFGPFASVRERGSLSGVTSSGVAGFDSVDALSIDAKQERTPTAELDIGATPPPVAWTSVCSPMSLAVTPTAALPDGSPTAASASDTSMSFSTPRSDARGAGLCAVPESSPGTYHSTPSAADTAASVAPVAVSIHAAKREVPGSTLVVAEERAVGAVSSRTLIAYASAAAGSAWVLAPVMGVLLLSRGSRTASDWFLAWWTGNTPSGTPEAVSQMYLSWYAVAVLVVFVTVALQGVVFAFLTLGASRTFHDRVFVSVMRGTSAWFDSQPTGRILARFTADLDLIDNAIPSNVEQTSELLFTILLSLVLIAVLVPWILIPFVPLGALFMYITRMFRQVSRELKRLDNLTKAPLVQHAQAAGQGVASIRVFRQGIRFLAQNTARVDESSQTFWALYVANRWLACRLDNFSAIIAALTVGLCIANRGTLSPSLAALAIVQSLQITGILQFSVRLVTETEAQFTCVERLNHYSEAIPHELLQVGTALTDAEAELAATTGAVVTSSALATQAAETASQSSAASAAGGAASLFQGWNPAAWSPPLRRLQWPAHGRLEFRNVCARYRPGLPLALHGVSFCAQPGMAVGVVGRTGAGKSTLALALFRLLELHDQGATAAADAGAPPLPGGAAATAATAADANGTTQQPSGGSILLDGIDISRVNIYQLRSRLSVIAQDPVLWRGTLRANVDIFAQHSDAQVAAALEQAGLGAFVAAHPLRLARPVAEGGGNCSVGERQLIALARALLRASRVCVCDEATSSVDLASSRAITATIRGRMRGATLLVIAHRLQTVIDCDRVLVLGAGGRLLEYDHPAALLGLVPSREPPPAVPAYGERAGSPTASGAGTFAHMVSQTGPEESAALRRAAAEAAAQSSL